MLLIKSNQHPVPFSSIDMTKLVSIAYILYSSLLVVASTRVPEVGEIGQSDEPRNDSVVLRRTPLIEFEESEYPITPNNKMYPRGYAGSYPQTPFNELYPRESLDESLDPLGYGDESTAEAFGLLMESGCAFLGTVKNVVLEGAKSRMRGAGNAAAVYAVRRVFGYELTTEDQSKLEQILANPSWMPILIDQLHKACASDAPSTSTNDSN